MGFLKCKGVFNKCWPLVFCLQGLLWSIYLALEHSYVRVSSNILRFHTNIFVSSFLSRKCTIWKLFGLCMLFVLGSLLWVQLTCSGDMSQTAGYSHLPHQPCPVERQSSSADDPSWGPHKMALIVPFRERFEELLIFVPYMHAFLNKKKIRHKIFIVNQLDHFRWVPFIAGIV